MRRNLDTFERIIRLLLGAFALFAAFVLFKHPLARLAAGAFGVLGLAECAFGVCLSHARLGMLAPGDRLKPETLRLLGIVAIQIVLAYEWWSAGWEKVSSPGFVANISQTLAVFASKNPFPWYKSFLEGRAMRNATAFAYAVEWSQVLIALALAASAALLLYAHDGKMRRLALCGALIALFGGAWMNANFYLAAGWTGPGTKGVNVVMFWTQAVLMYVWASTLRAEKPLTSAPGSASEGSR